MVTVCQTHWHNQLLKSLLITIRTLTKHLFLRHVFILNAFRHVSAIWDIKSSTCGLSLQQSGFFRNMVWLNWYGPEMRVLLTEYWRIDVTDNCQVRCDLSTTDHWRHAYCKTTERLYIGKKHSVKHPMGLYCFEWAKFLVSYPSNVLCLFRFSILRMKTFFFEFLLSYILVYHMLFIFLDMSPRRWIIIQNIKNCYIYFA